MSSDFPGEIQVLHQDEHFIAINKPSGVLSQPNPGKDQDQESVISIIQNQGYNLQGGDDPSRQGLIHRLDRDTSGILLLALSQEAHEKFQNLFKTRSVVKTYHFPAFGRIKRMEFTRKDPLGRHPVKRTTRQVDPEGRDAETHYKMVKLGQKNFSFWEAHPKTGRTHQIRVHAEAAGLTIVGDPHYGKQNQIHIHKEYRAKHTMLHCRKLAFTHPFTEESISLEADYPEDFLECLKQLNLEI